MDRQMTRHHLFDPEGLPPAVGFSYGAVAAGGRTLHIAGITGPLQDGALAEGLVDQFGVACESVARVIAAADGEPSDLVAMTIFTTVVGEYKANLPALGERYRGVFGRHYPPIALIGVAELFDPAALVELVCVAVVPEST
jgi:enamine deaminase RidA (YjgF/YER057c/UK114 family)